jgi:hypothetical protein
MLSDNIRLSLIVSTFKIFFSKLKPKQYWYHITFEALGQRTGLQVLNSFNIIVIHCTVISNILIISLPNPVDEYLIVEVRIGAPLTNLVIEPVIKTKQKKTTNRKTNLNSITKLIEK